MRKQLADLMEQLNSLNLEKDALRAENECRENFSNIVGIKSVALESIVISDGGLCSKEDTK